VDAEAHDQQIAPAARAAIDEVKGFLQAHPPFDALGDDELERVATAAEVEFFPAGEMIFAQHAGPVEHLRVIRAGSVELALAGRVLDLLGPGELFGHASMLSGLPPGFSARAEEDTLCYRVPAEVGREVLARPESVAFVARSLLAMHAKAPSALAVTSARPDPANRPVRTLLRGAPVICTPDTTIREAALQMSEHGASAIVVKLGETLGILTDRDLRARVVAAGLSYDEPVSAAMTAPAYTVGPDALGGDVLLRMLERGVRHFPVVALDGSVLGVVEAVDVQAADTVSSFNLRRAISRANGFDELGRAAAGLRPAVLALAEARVAATSISRMYSTLLDAIARRSIELAVAEVGEELPPFTWFALGSHARREAVPASDIDSAIAWREADGNDVRLREELHRVGRIVASRMEEWGFAVDTHGASAADLLFVRTVESWHKAADSWIKDPTQDKALVLSSLLADSRPVWGVRWGLSLSEPFRAARSERALVRLLARLALSHRPPTGFMRGFVLEHDGEHRGRLDIKQGGILPVAALARWGGIAAGVTSASTVERLRSASAAGTITADDARTLEEAFELFTDLRLGHQVTQLRSGEQPDDFLDPAQLGALTRSHLKEAFRAVASVQRRIGTELSLPGS